LEVSAHVSTFVRLIAFVVVAALACASNPVDPNRYRLEDSGHGWYRSGDDEVLLDLEDRYPEFLPVVLDPTKAHDLDTRRVRDDLESQDAGRERFDALNAVAIAYYELNSRAQRGLLDESGGATYLADSFRAAKLLAVPWRAYGEVQDPLLRDAILDFFEDVATGDKQDARATAPRLARTVASLAKKESDPERLARIRRLTRILEQLEASL
jgi:hypothetical protein